MNGSIRRRLILLILGSVAIVWAVAVTSSYRQALQEAHEWADARLEQAARTLIRADAHDLTVLAQDGLNLADDDGDDESARRLFFEVRGPDGSLLAGNTGVADHARASRNSHSVAEALATPRGWHVYTFRDSKTARTVRILQSESARGDLATGVARRVAIPVVLALPALALLVWISISHSLAPLYSVSKEIRMRDAGNLDPVKLRDKPNELHPMIEALNSLLLRIQRSIDRERAFTSDAAHELMTPLAAIKVQAQVALVELDPAKQRVAMERVVNGVDRSAHLANELLLLARLDGPTDKEKYPVVLDEIARGCVATRAGVAATKDIALALDANCASVILADEMLIHILIGNLIDNAIKYGRVGGRAEIKVRTQGKFVDVLVFDDGPGVAKENMARLSDRFFRAPGNRERGSGLGLSIVARIVAHLNADLRFTQGIDGKGLGVGVRFPVCQI